jgi:hypothetical protein
MALKEARQMDYIGTALTALSCLILFGAFYAVLTGGHAGHTKDGRTATWGFETSPVRYSLTIGSYFAVGLTLLYFGNRDLLFKGISYLPFVKLYIISLLAMKTVGGPILFAVLVAFFGMFAFIMRRFVVTGATYAKGQDMDMDKRVVTAWEKKQEKKRNAER